MMLTNLLSFVVFLLSFTLLSRGAEYTTMDDLGYEYLAASGGRQGVHTIDNNKLIPGEQHDFRPEAWDTQRLETRIPTRGFEDIIVAPTSTPTATRMIANPEDPEDDDYSLPSSDIDSAVKHIYDSFSLPGEVAFPSTSIASLFNNKNYVASLRADDKVLPVAVEKQEKGAMNHETWDDDTGAWVLI
ncbi:hypothetical protein D6D15_09214 [Aureobasidium pullulans]|uniref:Uncharacterized protein n=1 Tax=Aureobasidium pullulans TaxID=5580 RepID=A0A4S9AV07_AURPU|nr:hypothetical protein D6D15_09214 [Aureobasidium pullulans]